MPSLADLFDEEEQRRIKEGRIEADREKAEWEALSPEAKKAYLDGVEAKYDMLEQLASEQPDDDVCDGCGDADCEGDCNDDE